MLEPEPPPSQEPLDLAAAPPELELDTEQNRAPVDQEPVGATNAPLSEPLLVDDAPIDWEDVRVCPQPPESNGCSPPGKHCSCVGYLGLAPEGTFDRHMQTPGVVQRCIGLMSHLPCPEDHVAYSDCSAAVRAKGLSRAERVFFSCAARYCDGTY